MGIVDADNLSEHIENQIQTAIDSADVILFVVDTRAGFTPLDQEVAKRLRYLNVPVLCVANKTDAPTLDSQADEFYKMGAAADLRQHQQNRGKRTDATRSSRDCRRADAPKRLPKRR